MYINKREFEKLNIIKWHEQGYTGRGVKVANLETANPKLHYLGRVHDPFKLGSSSFTNTHGNKTLGVINQVAPDSEYYLLSSAMQQEGKTVVGRMVEETIPFIEEKKIQLINASLGGYSIKEIEDSLNMLIQNGSTFVTSVGNTGERGAGSYAESPNWISIGAVGLSRKGETFLKPYSSRSEFLDFVSYSGLNVHDSRKGYENNTMIEEGTSFSSPLFCGMLALVQQFFKEKTGEYLKRKQLIKFIKDNVKQLDDKVKSTEYGYGLFILPNPKEIDVNKYTQRKEEIDLNFKDVEEGKWYYKAIEYVTKENLMNGYEDGTFRPNEPLTRAQLAQVLFNQRKK